MIYDRMDDATREVKDDEYIVALQWQGKELLYATVTEPHRLPVPQLVIMQRPKGQP